jgi:uncharacterized repeat protein (TIGR01451 family)
MNTFKHPNALRPPAQPRLDTERAQRFGFGALGTQDVKLIAQRHAAGRAARRVTQRPWALRCPPFPAPPHASANLLRAFVDATRQTFRFVYRLFVQPLQAAIAMKSPTCFFSNFAVARNGVFVAGAVLFTSTAWAQGNPAQSAVANAPALRSELTVKQVVVVEKDKEALRPATEVKPGDVLQYTASYVNSGTSPVKQLVASLPIPLGTQWVDAVALPRPALASIDGKVFAPVPLMRRVKKADGRVVEEAVPLSEYRAMRWPEQIVAAGATYTVSTRVRVTELGVIDAKPSKTPAAAGNTSTTVSSASAYSNNTTAVR